MEEQRVESGKVAEVPGSILKLVLLATVNREIPGSRARDWDSVAIRGGENHTTFSALTWASR